MDEGVMAAQRLINNSVTTNTRAVPLKTRTTLLAQHFIPGWIEEGNAEVSGVPTTKMVADELTKCAPDDENPKKIQKMLGRWI